MKRIDEGAQEAARTLRTEHPHAVDAAVAFAPDVKRNGVLKAWVDLMGQAHTPDPDRSRAAAELRDGLIPWWVTHGAPSGEPKAILTWLIQDQTPEQLGMLRLQLLPLLEHLISQERYKIAAEAAEQDA